MHQNKRQNDFACDFCVTYDQRDGIIEGWMAKWFLNREEQTESNNGRWKES